MIEYIYFVKCPNCEDEPFYFFNEAKEFAMSCLTQKPIITQIEVNRNDFGECVDSADLGTVWSWEEMMKETDAEPAASVFTKDDLKCTDCDAEFDSLDNSLDSIPDNFRMPVPSDMAIKDLVEALEENEDVVECKWCEELFDKSECRYEVDLGWLCDRCQAAIMSRGESLTFREGSLDEAVDPRKMVELEYDELTVTLQGPMRDVDDWDEIEYSDRFIFRVDKDEVATLIWENWITEEDVKDVPGGLEALEDDAAWEKFLETHFDGLFEKYNKQILDYFRDDAEEDFRDQAQEEYSSDFWSDDADRAFDAWRDEKFFGESVKPVKLDVEDTDRDKRFVKKDMEYAAWRDEQLSGKLTEQKSFLEEFEEPDAYRERLELCPECGAVSFDSETGICINCGFNIV